VRSLLGGMRGIGIGKLIEGRVSRLRSWSQLRLLLLLLMMMKLRRLWRLLWLLWLLLLLVLLMLMLLLLLLHLSRRQPWINRRRLRTGLWNWGLSTLRRALAARCRNWDVRCRVLRLPGVCLGQGHRLRSSLRSCAGGRRQVIDRKEGRLPLSRRCPLSRCRVIVPSLGWPVLSRCRVCHRLLVRGGRRRAVSRRWYRPVRDSTLVVGSRHRAVVGLMRLSRLDRIGSLLSRRWTRLWRCLGGRLRVRRRHCGLLLRPSLGWSWHCINLPPP
jgi:hypothetical protein